MNAQEFIKQYKEKELIHSVNFEGDLMASERQIEQMLEEYAKIKALHIADVMPRLLKDLADKHGEDVNKVMVGMIGKDIQVWRYDTGANPIWKTLEIISPNEA